MRKQLFVWPELLFLLALAGVLAAQAPATSGDAWKKDLLAWRAQRAAGLQSPNGWRALIGLDWLQPGDNSFGSAAGNTIVLRGKVAPHLGTLRLTNDGVELLPPAGGFPAELKVDGRGPIPRQRLVTDADEHPSKLTAGTVSIVVIRRGDRTGLRTRDSQAPTLASFQGLRWYDPNPAYRIQARWIPYQPVKQIKVPTVIGTDENYTVPGVAEFTLEGKTLRLEPVLEEPNAKQLFVIMRDATSKTETYQASRFLYADVPDHGLAKPGTLVLDFNRAYNPPCAFTNYATCPLPPKGNILPVAIPAGEKRYHP